MAEFIDRFDVEYRRKLMERAIEGDEDALVALGIRKGKPKKDIADGWRPADAGQLDDDAE